MTTYKNSRFHVHPVREGTYGELSKIQEELDEALDAETRGQELLLMIELADIIGAVAGVAERYGYTLESLIQFSELVRSVRRQDTEETLHAEDTNEDLP